MLRCTRFVFSATVLATLSAVALTSCSGGSSGSTSAASGSTAGSSPSAATGVDALALVKKASNTSGALKSAHMDTTTVLAGKTTTIVGDVSYRPVQLEETVSIAGQKVHELLVGKTFYIQTPGAGTAAKPWIAVSVAKMSKLVGIDFDSLLNNARADQTVSLLSASGDLKVVGTETVNGASTQHLRGTVDLNKAMAAMTASSSGYKTIQQMVQSAGITDTHIDLWVNAQDIPVKFVETYSSKLGAGSTTMSLTKLNQPVHITAPKPSQVSPFPG